MNCGQTASIAESGQNEPQHHNLPMQNRHVRGDGSTASLGQVDMLTASDKLCRWLACWNIATDITGAHSSAHVWTLSGGKLILRMLVKHVNRSLVVAQVYNRGCDGQYGLSRKYYLQILLFCLCLYYNTENYSSITECHRVVCVCTILHFTLKLQSLYLFRLNTFCYHFSG